MLLASGTKVVLAKFAVKLYLTMPLHKIHWYEPGSGWGVWKIEEAEADLARALPEADQCPDQIRFPRKRLEWLSGRHLLSRLFMDSGLTYNGISKDEHGKPFALNSTCHISLTNSFPFVAARISPDFPVGIDLEILRPKMTQVIPRVLSSSEKQDAGSDPVKLCVYWSAKESLFKVLGIRNVHFAENLNVEPFEFFSAGSLIGHIRLPDQAWRLELDYLASDEFILTTTKSIIKE